MMVMTNKPTQHRIVIQPVMSVTISHHATLQRQNMSTKTFFSVIHQHNTTRRERDYITNLEGTHESLVHAHHGSSVIKLSTVVGCREEGDQLPLGKELISILHNLYVNRNGNTVRRCFKERNPRDLGSEQADKGTTYITDTKLSRLP